ncbi:hypothetical protein QBE52_03170 [Clostridiaceae bacterium 35-E11]
MKWRIVSFKEEINGRLTKIELSQEELKDKVSEAFEATDTLAETNDRQHEEIMREIKGDS